MSILKLSNLEIDLAPYVHTNETEEVEKGSTASVIVSMKVLQGGINQLSLVFVVFFSNGHLPQP